MMPIWGKRISPSHGRRGEGGPAKCVIPERNGMLETRGDPEILYSVLRISVEAKMTPKRDISARVTERRWEGGVVSGRYSGT